MSSIPATKITDQECEKGQLTQRPPIPYAISKAETILKASRETVKMKTSEGEVKMAVLGDSPGLEEYLQHHNAFLQMFARKKWDDEFKLTKAVGNCCSPCEEARENSERRDGARDVPEDNSVGGGGSRAQQGPSP